MSLDGMWWCFLYIGVNGLSFVRRTEDIGVTVYNVVWFYTHLCEWLICCAEEGQFGSLDVMSWGVMYIGVNGLSSVRKSDIWVTGCNVVVFYVHRCEGLIFVQRRKDFESLNVM